MAPDVGASSNLDGGSERVPASFLPEPGPAPIFCPIASADDHLLEPLDLFVDRVPQQYRERVPYVEYNAEGAPYWVIDGTRLPITITNGASGRSISDADSASIMFSQSNKYEEFRSGVWDSAARLADMDHAGVYVSLCFPSVVFGFAGTRLSTMEYRGRGLGGRAGL